MNCTKCNKTFSRGDNKRRHEKTCPSVGRCTNCGTTFYNEHNLYRHELYCGAPPAKKSRRELETRQLLAMKPDENYANEYESAFQNRLKSYFIRCNDTYDLNRFCYSVKDKIILLLEKSVLEFRSIKFNMSIDCVMINTAGDEMEVTLKTKNDPVFKESNLDVIVNKMFGKLDRELGETQHKKSGWKLKAVDGLRLKINKYTPLKGSSYIELPNIIKRKKACLNVQNTDTKCFMYSILSKFVLKDPQRVSNYDSLKDRYDFSCINFPTPLNEIQLFEKLNNISINVFGVESDGKIYPLKVVEEEKEDHRDLLLLENNGERHYVCIKNFEKLVCKQKTKHKERILICKRCMTHFDSRGGMAADEKLKQHKLYCNNNKPARIDLPSKKPFAKFEHVERSMRVPYVVYCDFESILTPIQTCQPNPETQFSNNYQLHEPISFCCYLKMSDEVASIPSDLPTQPYLYRGSDAAKHFIEYIRKIGEKVSEIYSRNEPMIKLTEEHENRFNTSNICYLCEKKFTVGDVKVRDHCHISGQFRGAAHHSCNLRYQVPTFLPVLLHNLSGYDSHFIVRELGYDDKEIRVIPNNQEKYISFSKVVTHNLELRFLDTFRFMSSSLETLVKNLPEFKEISKFFSPEHLPLLTRKGVCPYDYITSQTILEDGKLPPMTEFYNKLTDSDVTKEDYSHALKVWSTFGFKTLGEYLDHYLLTDVLLLADVFESFRNVTMKTHKLDPCNYFTLPGLSWDAMLRFTDVRLDLLQDYDQILMIEKGIRGGICQVSHRYMQANNKYLPNYDPEFKTSFITYQDCNNLYGHAMNQPLPYAGFEWVKPEEIDLKRLSADDDEGYILEVDVDYPSEIHDLHNNLPFLPENIKINNEVKLVPHLSSRNNYVVHYITLKQALEHGLVLKKIHKALKFQQSKWLKPYIDHNTKLRAAATNDFEKDLYKLYNNSVFGKTMENVRARINIKLISNPKKIEKAIAKPEFLDRTIYNKNLVAVHMAKKRIKLDKPLYIGLSVLDLSKVTMYHYHYDVMLPKYGPERLLLGYVDTDAFIYFINTDDIFNDFKEMLEYLDTSDYPEGHPCCSKHNAKVVGKFKDEAKGEVISEFIGLRAKMYALKINGFERKKAKGVKSTILKSAITFEHYMSSLIENKTFRHSMRFIRSKNHHVTSLLVNKISLSPHDDKRIILEDGIRTRGIGHYRHNNPSYDET